MAGTPEKLDDEAVRAWAAAHHPWSVGQGSDRLLRTYTFDDFGAAMQFMAAVHPTIERLDHHPEWTNVYNQVWVVLSTHSIGGVTRLDLELGEVMDAAAVKVGARS